MTAPKGRRGQAEDDRKAGPVTGPVKQGKKATVGTGSPVNRNKGEDPNKLGKTSGNVPKTNARTRTPMPPSTSAAWPQKIATSTAPPKPPVTPKDKGAAGKG